MELWRSTFRDGFAPVLSTAALEALATALRDDDPLLIQGATTQPPPLQCVADWPCEAGCGISYAAWQGDKLETVGDVEFAFAKACFDADQRLGEPAGCRHFLNFFDDTPRDTMRAELLPEVERELARRRGEPAGVTA